MTQPHHTHPAKERRLDRLARWWLNRRAGETMPVAYYCPSVYLEGRAHVTLGPFAIEPPGLNIYAGCAPKPDPIQAAAR